MTYTILYYELRHETEKRSDMLALTDRLTVPQIFFNENHIGGADETIKVLESWDNDEGKYENAKERYESEIESQPDPVDVRLQLPSEPPEPNPEPPPRGPRQGEDEFTLPNNDKQGISYSELYHTLLQILPCESKPYRGKSYKNCFTGSEAVKTIQEYYFVPKEKAIPFLLKLQQSKMLDHVTQNHEIGDNSYYFRLQDFFQPKILNTMRIWTDRTDPDPNGLAIRLKKILEKVESEASDDDGNVDYIKAKTDVNFYIFQEACCELQKIDMLLMDQHTRLAFSINVYNIMIKHAFIQLGIPTTNYQRAYFFGRIGYNIGGLFFSFNELENGVIRSNQKAPFTLTKPFSSSDPRLKLALEIADPRIHFALNCGAKSCPPIKNFSSQSIHEELRIVSLAFHESDQNTYVDDLHHELYVSKILNWYRSDFASSLSDLPIAVLPFLRGAKKDRLQKMIKSKKPINVKFFEYDWSTNASNMNIFTGKDLDSVSYSVSALF